MTHGRFLKVLLRTGDNFVCVPEDEPRVDAGVTTFLESGETRDVLLDLTLVEGFTFRVLASMIFAWFISTPEARRNAVILSLEQKAEDDALKQELNPGWSDESIQ